MEFGTTPRLAAAVTARVKKATALPVIVKLSPNVSDIVAIARAVVDAGADAITLINTLRGMAIDIKQRRPALGNTTGGLSGPAIKPVALYMVYKVAGAVRVPVIGCGGIVTAQDALEFLMAGATAVQMGTANFLDPAAALGVADGIEEYMSEHGLSDLGQVAGLALHP
jgi:dihydroorotate dehydrogenase (NAD+) catalytic subunit